MTCGDFRFNHKADIYYAVFDQNEYTNEMQQSWELGYSEVPCELSTDKFNSDARYAIQTKNDFFDIQQLIFGRFSQEIRVAPSGEYIPLSSIMVTNVRSRCDDTLIYFESSVGGFDPSPTLYEVRTFQPFTNPWGQIEYYKTQLFRMVDQTPDGVML